MVSRNALLSLALVGGLTGCGLSHSPAMIHNPEAALRARALGGAAVELVLAREQAARDRVVGDDADALDRVIQTFTVNF